MLKSSAPYVRTEADWKTVRAIVRLTSQRPNVAGLAYECLAVVVRDPRAITPVSYMPLLETSLQFIVRYKQVGRSVSRERWVGGRGGCLWA